MLSIISYLVDSAMSIRCIEFSTAFNFFIFGLLTSSVATHKNRNFLFWFIAGSMLGVIPLILVSFLKPLKTLEKKE